MDEADKPWKARRKDNKTRVFGITQRELFRLKPDEVRALEVDFGEGWVSPAKWMQLADDPMFLPVAEDAD